MAAWLLRRQFPTIRLTEAHPKALLWLLRLARKDRRAADVTINDLAPLVQHESRHLNEHERDAAIGALSALRMLQGAPGWRDIALDETGAFAPITPVEYWMPITATPANLQP
jgi:hypothetical protein